MTVLKILGFSLILSAVAFIGYRFIPTKEIVVANGFASNRGLKLRSDVEVEQVLPKSDVELQEIQIKFGTYSAHKKNEGGVLTVSFLEDDAVVQQWFLPVEKLVDNAYQPFTLEQAKKLNPNNKYTIKISYHYTDDNFIALWTNDDAAHGSFKNGKQVLEGSVCYKLVYVK